MGKHDKHAIAMNLEALDCVNRVDTGDDELVVVFARSEHAVGDFEEELDSDCYNAVKNEIWGTVFQEEPPIGNDKVAVYPQKDELRLRFVV